MTWIKCAERMPEHCAWVLVVERHERRGPTVFVALWEPDVSRWEFPGLGGSASADQITHWQPLPEPPHE